MKSFFAAALATFAFASSWGAAAGASAMVYETARGQRVTLSPISSLTCAEMEDMLARIDATGYREGRPRPIEAADAPLFDYESELSKALYERCVIAKMQDASVAKQ